MKCRGPRGRKGRTRHSGPDPESIFSRSSGFAIRVSNFAMPFSAGRLPGKRKGDRLLFFTLYSPLSFAPSRKRKSPKRSRSPFPLPHCFPHADSRNEIVVLGTQPGPVAAGPCPKRGTASPFAPSPLVRLRDPYPVTSKSTLLFAAWQLSVDSVHTGFSLP
jgi:hypothetical protein